MIKRISHIVLIILVLLGTIVLLGFSTNRNSLIPLQSLEILVDGNSGNHFVEAHDIRQLIKELFTTNEGRVLKPGKLSEIEKIISGMPHIDRAHVYRTIDGTVNIKARQRQPLLRVINSNNESYYLDTEGRMMPLSPNYTARVLIATGNIRSQYSAAVDLRQIENNKTPQSDKRLRDLFILAEFINRHSFWNALIDHIYVTPSGEFELIPKNGTHVVEFGNTENMEEKFHKLMTFYQNGLTQLGWHHYKRVNLKYSNQIVCSK